MLVKHDARSSMFRSPGAEEPVSQPTRRAQQARLPVAAAIDAHRRAHPSRRQRLLDLADRASDNSIASANRATGGRSGVAEALRRLERLFAEVGH